MEFKEGDVLRHIATSKVCVVAQIKEDNRVLVTTSDDEKKVYFSHELEECENRLSAV